ncbi:hypothetical protein LMG27174_02473 [Paraburkholderia rhynchosiae]|uniref:Integrase catalytic domain-containing protein n=1 Tax=Paraburkholderia rhynchosiae TaxID=487049 RepID=A0A6J5AQ15_9BURK|nr:hypothetical protein LMG27174_02473 [Paraburkholderia rhynchosiae]
MLATLQTLGVMPSLSRPGVRNDNPCSESLFKPLKYRPAYPQGVRYPFAARSWWAHWCASTSTNIVTARSSS